MLDGKGLYTTDTKSEQLFSALNILFTFTTSASLRLTNLWHFFFNQAQFFQISEFELADLTNETSAFGNRWSGTENVHQHQHNISSQTHSLGGGGLNKSFSPKRDAVAALFQWSVKKHAEHYQNIWRVILFIFVICMFVPLSPFCFLTSGCHVSSSYVLYCTSSVFT